MSILGDVRALKLDIVINLTKGSKTSLLALEMSVFDCDHRLQKTSMAAKTTESKAEKVARML